MSDVIRVVGIRAHGHHGVFAEEKRDGQEFVVDVALHCDLRAAGESDDLADTVNYADVAASVVDCIEDGALDLIEALAQRIARRILADKAIGAVDVVVKKPHAPIPAHHGQVSIEIHRTREDVA